ncbi:uncharacterized protein BP01DRAFT_426881 [Aspergillus saccharolyticus JOP 1030-1]|uniref:Uncharacterized protein n=1 Tax=Aspergillus saccharolyticus JOP 1030-1 TaxID=1450539 RepID=A0A318Z1B3_9EURO|nr:hypothetical protein BP01DRAFT_426881 [Aspergillus saccharolyticus JOP 1030-1]PYH40699.1 hypothetical protein BP01DRAFT_426881 [Aspergillus saccharolyticus JOP 1030-1]
MKLFTAVFLFLSTLLAADAAPAKRAPNSVDVTSNYDWNDREARAVDISSKLNLILASSCSSATSIIPEHFTMIDPWYTAPVTITDILSIPLIRSAAPRLAAAGKSDSAGDCPKTAPIIESVCGQPLQSFKAERICAPLNMCAAYLSLADAQQAGSHVSQGYYIETQARLTPIHAREMKSAGAHWIPVWVRLPGVTVLRSKRKLGFVIMGDNLRGTNAAADIISDDLIDDVLSVPMNDCFDWIRRVVTAQRWDCVTVVCD